MESGSLFYEIRSHMNKIAFFDFDGTLTDKDSLVLFALHSVGIWKYAYGLMASLPAIFKWKIGISTNSFAKEILLSHLYKGKSKDWFETKAKSFIRVVDDNLNDKGIEILKKHRAEGDEICIVTASPEIWIKPWAMSNGIKKVIGTELKFDSNGDFTGRFLTPNCHGKEKVERILKCYPEIKSCKTCAYSDSESDKPMLEVVDEGIMI